MVLGLFPVDPLSGENKYYIFAKGTYKVGRKGCDVIITKDKGVSRVHAEIFVDEMSSSKSSSLSCKIRIKDLSKYGTFINKNLGSMEKVHEFPNKETTLADGNLLSFGTGNASYKLSFIPLVFWVYTLEPNQVNHPLQDKLSSIGAHITYNFSQECTHVLIEELMPVREDLLDAIVAKKACVCSSWIESVAEEKIRTEIPSCSSHTSTLMVEGVSVKLADPRTRENCLEGYTFVLDSINSCKFGNQLQSLLEISGAKVLFAAGFTSTSQGLDNEANNYVVCVIPGGSANKLGCFNKLSSLSRVNEMDLICAVLTGKLDRSIFISPCVVVSSSCSTDETIVADSEAEDETATSVRETAAAHSREVVETVNKVEAKEDCAAPNYVATFRPSRGSVPLKREADTESESGNLDVVCSQHLIVRDTSTRTAGSTANNEAINFKRFRKRDVQSGNSFNNLIPFSKNPYKGSDDGNEEMIESAKEEKRRKQMEAMAEDLFNNVKGRRRGVAGSIHGLLTNAY
ncbi:nijmegen breakage syndrome 1 protein isoform X1 [Morus notabilis]|uniref:nijmegen breakage syndrome 1 protein isoform X1 n=1 Tax=Morus notabilis TaxID=981085 RepID=UPI000CED5426|nr:nijmegen breakage syndrome 1 protein isoform X1 [Morus notabilis]XP_024023512.1 nijmegen breakage syndrome 1 protein isoform X1 [Morus notabilis]